MRSLLVLGWLLLAMSCGGEPGERATRDSFEGDGYSARDLVAYGIGRTREIQVLRQPAPPSVTVLDSLGAAAAGMAIADYDRMLDQVEAYLKDWNTRTATGGRQAVSALDSALARLDSIRVERMVLAVRAGG